MHRVAIGACVLFLGLGTISPVHGQLAVGARAGVNVADLAIEADGTDEATNARTGVLAAGVLAYSPNPWLSLQIEGRYTQKGTTQPQEEGFDALLRMSYAEVPLLAQLVFPTGSIARPHVHAGGYASFELACSLVAEGMGATLDIGCDDSQGRPKSDYGLVFGLGLDFAVGPGAATVDAEYAMGLKNLSDMPGATAYHRVIAIAAGFKFFL